MHFPQNQQLYLCTSSESVKTARKAKPCLGHRFLTSKIRDEEKNTPVASPCSNAFCVKFWSHNFLQYSWNLGTHVYQAEDMQMSKVKLEAL